MTAAPYTPYSSPTPIPAGLRDEDAPFLGEGYGSVSLDVSSLNSEAGLIAPPLFQGPDDLGADDADAHEAIWFRALTEFLNFAPSMHVHHLTHLLTSSVPSNTEESRRFIGNVPKRNWQEENRELG